MGTTILKIALLADAAFALAGCGLADSRSPVPEFMRNKAPDAPPMEAPPDVNRMVRDGLDSVFVAGSYPHHVRVSPATHDLRGLGWTACVQADLTSATGKPLGTQTYRITINGGAIMDRRRAEPEDNCTTEAFEPV
jgi:hypothetical protein